MAPSSSLSFLLLLSLLSVSTSQPSPAISGIFLSCGASSPSVDSIGLRWLPDSPYVFSGDAASIQIPNLVPILSTYRYFRSSLGASAKFCFVLPAVKSARYLIRTVYFAADTVPPVFDQIVDGTFWSVVNTTADRSAGLASYYEGVFMAGGKTLSLCVAANRVYTKSDPFISAIEMVRLDSSVYNGTDLATTAMGLIARSKFGATNPIERYPADRFDRYWHSFTDNDHAVSSTHNILPSDFWNLPPSNLFDTALVADTDVPLILSWPPMELPNSTYYIALYFADTLPSNSRTFDVYINDRRFYRGLMVTSSGLVVFSTQWVLSGPTKLILVPSSGLPPLISGGEVFGLFPLGRLTFTRDANSLLMIRKSLNNPPKDWYGDPCMPSEYPWTGVTCFQGSDIRVTALNLSNMGLSGSLSPYIQNMTALVNISFASNNLTGPIPEMGKLRNLQRLHLQNNAFIGQIPQSLGNISPLTELFLENNHLSGPIPAILLSKQGLNLRLLPGNNFSTTVTLQAPPPSS